MLSDCHPVPVSLSPYFSLSDTHRWPLNKRLCSASGLLSTTLMIPVVWSCPKETHKLHFSPLALSPLFTPFLMHSSNPSESYHAALPCSLNKSSFFHPLPLLRPPLRSPSSPALFPSLSRSTLLYLVRRSSSTLLAPSLLCVQFPHM